MNFPTIIDVAIGLFFIYLILSLIVSELQEALATLWEFRAKHLRNSIQILLGDDEYLDTPITAVPHQVGMTEELYNHALIQSLNQRGNNKKKAKKSAGPSYIPSDMFAAALVEVLKAKLDLSGSETLEGIANRIQTSQLLPKNLKENLYTITQRAQQKVGTAESEFFVFQAGLANWFDNSMERASGVYKRESKTVAVIIGFLIAIMTNADTFNMIDRIYKDDALRTTVSQLTEQVVTENPGVKACLQDAKSFTDKAEKSTYEKDCIAPVKDSLRAADSLSLLPFGWDLSNFPGSLWQQFKQQVNPSTSQGVLSGLTGWLLGFLKILVGWFVTGIAVAMGSPFWFDLLGKVVNVRNSGKKPKTAAETQEAES